MKFTVWLLAVVVLFLIAGAIPLADGAHTVVFRTPMFVLVLATLGVTLVLCGARHLSLRRADFALAHLGVVVILAGAFVGFVAGRKRTFAVPVVAEHTIREIPALDDRQTPIRLDFGITVARFDVAFYEPTYNLYTPVPAPGDRGRAADYVFVKKLALGRDGRLMVDERVALDRARLADAGGELREQIVLDDGRVLQIGRTPKHFAAALRLSRNDQLVREAMLEVNRPVSFAGWRFYLMDYDHQHRRYVVLSARRDPGRLLVIAGIWAVMSGTAVMCWRRSGE
ncbi:MAG: cytochrome c biogenesis protein ResB [Kiritimatiellae bacterium]|nr:cytochrome c biogenesis protein ResB [Kiritimatiellia bacterium]